MLESIKGLNVVEKKGVPFLQFEIFKNQPVIHGFSTRLGGVSRGEWSSMNISFTRGDNEADVKENHERLAAAVGYRTEDLVLTQQVHKTDILRVGKEDTGDVYRYPNRRIREFDGLVTDEPGVMLMTFFADCVPLSSYDPIKKAVGNAHSGWRGTVGAMGQKMVERMHEEFGSRPEDILAVIGPSICRNCYGVSDDVIAEFHKAFPWMTGFYEDTYVSVMFARDFDTALDDGKLIHTISDTSYQSFVTIDYAPVEHSVTRSMLRSAYGNNERAISQEADSKKSNNQAVTGISYSKKKKRAELEGYMDQLDDDSEECIQAGLLVVVTAGSEDELAARIESMQRTAKNVGAYLETYNYVQLKAFNTALPTGVRQVKKMRSFYTSSLVALQPFFAPEVTEPGGIFYGINNTTKSLVFANRKSLTSPQGIIIGPTGAGKSFLIKETEITQTLLSTDDDLQIIDPQNETQNVCAMYSGLFLDFTPKSDIHINPMEVPLSLFKAGTKKDRELFIADVTKWATSFTEAIMKKIVYTQEHSNFIEKAVQNVYDKVFSRNNLIQPTIKDVRKELMILEDNNENVHDKKIIHEMVNCLYSYTDGVYDMFAYPSDVDISTYRLVAFGLKNVDENYWQPVMISIMFFLSIRMNDNQELQEATRLVVDETQVVTRNASSAQILLNAVITYRKFGGIVTLAMQNLTRALENPDLRDMFQNCGYKMFFQQVGEDAERLSKIQDLTQAEYDALKSDRPGRSVMVWGKKVIILDSLMSKDNPLYEVFSTNFHEKAEKARKEKMKEAAYGD